MVKVRYFGNLAHQTNLKEEFFEANSMKSLLKAIKVKYGSEVHKNAKASLIVINENNAADTGGFNAKLKDDDTVKFLPICGGG